MGSLVAVLGADPPQGRAAQTIQRMLDAAPHRGRQTRTATVGDCTVAVSRDAGLTDAWVARDRTHVAALHGCIDNADRLLRDLVARGTPPSGDSPAHLALAAFLAFRQAAPSQLRGVYAAVISDGHRLWCFRDHLGFATLFHRLDGRECLVASEAKQVLAGAGLPRRVDAGVVADIFFGDYDDETPCALRGVQRLPKSMLLQGSRDGLSTVRYWEPERLIEQSRLTEAELADRFDELMTQAVSRCMTGSDVVSLSGGIDSPTVAGYAAPVHLTRYGRPLPALSAVYPEQPAVDEESYIRKVAGQLGMPLHTYAHNVHSLDGLDRWSQLLDGPVPTVMVSEIHEFYLKARELGFRTVLSGELAEFLVDMSEGVVGHLLFKGRVDAALGRLRAQRARGVPVTVIAQQLLSPMVPRSLARYVARRQRGGAGVPDWLDTTRVLDVWAARLTAPRHRWRSRQLSAFEGPGITLEADEVIQSLCGIKVRRPWADVDLWEFFLGLPAEQRYPDGPRRKELVRRLARGRVPDAILDRTDKTVFNDSFMARIDYPSLERWVIDPPQTLPGVDYETLAARLRQRHLTAWDYMWAKDLATAHAFLATAGC